jgi:hypothetical protein
MAACSSSNQSSTTGSALDRSAGSSSSASASHGAGADGGNPAAGGDGGCLCDPATQYEWDDGTGNPICLPLSSSCAADPTPCHVGCIKPPPGANPAATDCVSTPSCGYLLTPLSSDQ